jgi:hypothetical protein
MTLDAKLPDGLYPFNDERLPLSELAMIEAPPQLEALFKSQGAANGIQIVRDEPVELRCNTGGVHAEGSLVLDYDRFRILVRACTMLVGLRTIRSRQTPEKAVSFILCNRP